MCIKGKITGGANRTVWCSAGWNYEYTELKIDKAYPLAKIGASTSEPSGWLLAGTGNGDTPADQKSGDQGACCYSSDVMATFAALINNGAVANGLKTDLFNKWTCPAKFTSSWLASGPASDWFTTKTKLVMSLKPWWCSDGSYNLTADDAYGTTGATASNNNAVLDTTGGNAFFTAADFYPNAFDKDRRDELLLAQCRQKRTICENKNVVESATASTMKRTLKSGANGFYFKEKCTWVLRSKTKAPTFSISNATINK